MHPLLSDPWVAEQIDLAIAPYRGKWTDQQIQAFREKMAWTLATHPNARTLLARERPHDVDRSGELVIPAHDEPAPPARGGKTG